MLSGTGPQQGGRLDAASGISSSAILEQTARILASPAFQKSKRLSRFLSYAVDNALAGNEGALKESVLALQVFDRTSDFDPRNDPIVRVDARRLRARVSEYYSNEGTSDPLQIEFEPGSYVPRFSQTSQDREPASDGKALWKPAKSLLVLDLLRKGRKLLDTPTPQGVINSLAIFERAAAISPENPVPHLGIGAASLWKAFLLYESPHTAMQRVRAAATRAIALDPARVEAHTLLGIVLAVYDYNFAAANAEFMLALRLQPSSPLALQAQAVQYLAPMGLLAEATSQMRGLVEKQPKRGQHWFALGLVRYLKRDFEDARFALEKALAINPRFVPARYHLALVYEQLGRYDLASKTIEGDLLQLRYPLVPLRAQALALVRADELQAAEAIVRKMELMYTPGAMDPISVAEVLAVIGDFDRAFQWLDRAYEDRWPSLVQLKSDPAYDAMRADSRFGEVVAKLGLSGEKRSAS